MASGKPGAVHSHAGDIATGPSRKSTELVRASAVPLLQVNILVVVPLLFLRIALPGFIRLLSIGPISLLARIIQGRFARVFFV
jgi:hypothetical protein